MVEEAKGIESEPDEPFQEDVIVLKTIDDVSFLLKRSTLEKCAYFEALLSKRWDGDGKKTIFIERYAEIVKHLVEVIVYGNVDELHFPKHLTNKLTKDLNYFSLCPNVHLCRVCEQPRATCQDLEFCDLCNIAVATKEELLERFHVNYGYGESEAYDKARHSDCDELRKFKVCRSCYKRVDGKFRTMWTNREAGFLRGFH